MSAKDDEEEIPDTEYRLRQIERYLIKLDMYLRDEANKRLKWLNFPPDDRGATQ
jgi:hypothetical protein